MRLFGKSVETSGLATASSVPLARAKTNVPEVEEQVRRGLRLARGRAERDEGRQHVEQERRNDQLAVADLVDDDAADDDAEAEAGEAGAADGAELRAGEAEVSAPVGQDAAADAEADAGGENGQEAGPEQALGVRRDGVGSESHCSCWSLVGVVDESRIALAANISLCDGPSGRVTTGKWRLAVTDARPAGGTGSTASGKAHRRSASNAIVGTSNDGIGGCRRRRTGGIDRHRGQRGSTTTAFLRRRHRPTRRRAGPRR